MHSTSDNGRLLALPPNAEDREAIIATLAGERQAFARLVEKYQRPVYATLRRLVRQHEDADDLLQECFLRAFQHLADFDLQRPFYPWLHRIAVNLAMTFLRRRAWQQRVETADIFPSREESPAQHAETREFNQALEQAIGRLPVEQRTVLLLRTREGLSYQEMSQTLGIEIGTVMSRLARAREKLRAWMRPHLVSRPPAPGGEK